MDELISEFVNETIEKLDDLDKELIKLEQTPLDHELIDNVFRLIHTIKGTSGFIGLDRLGKTAHACENVLSAIRNESLSPTADIVDAILKSIDVIREMVLYLSHNGEEISKDYDDLIHCLNAFLSDKKESGTSDPKPKKSKKSKQEKKPKIAEEVSEIHFNFSDVETPNHNSSEDESFVPYNGILEEMKKNFTEEVVNVDDIKNLQHLKNDLKQDHDDKKNANTPKLQQNQSIRVNIDVLEKLMQSVSELVLNRNQLLQLLRTHNDGQSVFQSPLHQLSYITTELQERMMKTRMQPIGSAWAQLPRLVRDLSHDLGKKIQIKMFGEDTELDRQLLEMIKDPLTHMVRNSCDHGIESPFDRVEKNKPDMGTITLSSYHEGGHIIIKLEDDGRGLNIEKIKQKALDNHILNQDGLDKLSPQQVMQLIFHPGFSTADKVTSVSGRGVGMDVVQTNIQKMGGIIDLSSKEGEGSVFLIKIPLTLAIVSVLIIESCDQKFAIPQLNVQEIVDVGEESSYKIEVIGSSKILRLRGRFLPLVNLSTLLDIQNQEMSDRYIVVCKASNQEFGLIVDCVFDTEEIVVKPVTYLIQEFGLFSGNTILGDGSVIMILDPSGISKKISSDQIIEEMNAHLHEGYGQKQNGEVDFILFSDSKGGQKAVPLELVSRIEKIEREMIEETGDQLVIQYRDNLMRLITLDPFMDILSYETITVLVFSLRKKNIGLIVHDIADITHAQFDIKMQSLDPKILGSTIIHNVATEIIDVSSLIENDDHTHSSQKHHDTEDHKHILVVEDSPLFLNITSQFLIDHGYRVTKAENGMQALSILEQNINEFHVIISDIDMPIMDGFNLARICSHLPYSHDIPMIAYTGFLDDSIVNKLENCGFHAWFSKTDKWGLLDAIEKYSHQEDSKKSLSETKDDDGNEEKDSKIFVSFTLGDHYFGFPVWDIRDVLKEYSLPPIPPISKEIKSFINLRGRIVTVLDLKEIMDYDIKTYENPMLVVVDYKGESFGLLVDEVNEVTTLPSTTMDPVPLNLSYKWKSLLTGIYKQDKNLLSIVNMNALFANLQPIRYV